MAVSLPALAIERELPRTEVQVQDFLRPQLLLSHWAKLLLTTLLVYMASLMTCGFMMSDFKCPVMHVCPVPFSPSLLPCFSALPQHQPPP